MQAESSLTGLSRLLRGQAQAEAVDLQSSPPVKRFPFGAIMPMCEVGWLNCDDLALGHVLTQAALWTTISRKGEQCESGARHVVQTAAAMTAMYRLAHNIS